jgi:hypothetical protein
MRHTTAPCLCCANPAITGVWTLWHWFSGARFIVAQLGRNAPPLPRPLYAHHPFNRAARRLQIVCRSLKIALDEL